MDNINQEMEDDFLAALAEEKAEASEIARLRADLAEQCRLLGMGGEREARLMAAVEELQRVVATQSALRHEAVAREAKLRDALRNIVFADEVRVLLRDTPTDDTTLREMIEAAKAEERESIIAEMPGGHSVDPQWVCDMIRARGGE